MAKKNKTVSETIHIDKDSKPILDLMLKRANLTLDEISESYITQFIFRNKDLLTPSENEKYKHLFLHQ